MYYFDIYITLIFIVKIVFIILATYKLHIKNKKIQDKKLLQTLEVWKRRVEFIFITLMSLLLVYLFNPRTNHISMIDSETKMLLFLFGLVLLLTENWTSFIYEKGWFHIL
jgi:hypothetical protein